MPKIPVYERQLVQDRGTPNVRIGVDAPASAFGGGEQQAIETAGKAFDIVADTYAKAKQDADTTAAQAEIIKLKNSKNFLLNDPTQGALYTKGTNALGVVDKTLEAFDKQSAEREAAAANDDQKNLIRSFAASYRSDLQNDLMKHAGKEGQALQEQVADSGIKAAQDEAILNANDPEKIAKNMIEVNAYAADKARRLGMDGTTTKLYIQTEVSKTHSAILERKLNNGDDLAASEYFKANRDQFTGADASRLEKVLEEGSLRGESQRQTDAIMQAGLGPAAALEETRKIQDPKLRDETQRRVKDEYANRDFVRRQNEEQRSISVANLIDKTKSFDSIPAATVAGMSDAERTRWRTYANNLASGKEVPENSKDYYNLKLMAGNPETRNKFLQTNLLDYATSVKGTQLSELIKDQADARNGKGDALTKLDGFMSDAQIASDALKNLRYKEDSEEGRTFRSRLDQITAEKSRALGRKLTNDEMRTEANNLAVNVVTDKGWLWNSSKPAFLLAPEDQIQDIDIKTIPRTERANIEAALKRAGKPANPANISALYGRMLGGRRGN
jgi:hypothetical protein